MTLYLIGGLGADERVFKYLNINVKTQIINWILQEPNEELKSYAKRLTEQINKNEEFAILGVSFGGIIAIEMAKFIRPKKLILISSVESSNQLPKHLITMGKTMVLEMLPNSLIKPPRFILGYLFGSENRKLLHQIIKDTKPEFIRWALKTIVRWSNDSNITETIRIHGTKDRLIPLKGNAIKVEDGGHFMIVDRAKEISKIINEQLKYAG
ncbi:MAG: alpha/beta hydrolase [Saprospiraceae bacterium]|nr:alpha/beta hydrolase [Bacteroidota bacterium]MBK9564505.1 alpha/beta hydrolase [Saprospiraceae bacterium]